MPEKPIFLDHEGRLAVIETQIIAAKEEIIVNTALTKDGFDRITNLLQDNNGKGLCTRVALVEQSNNRLWLFIPLGVAIATTVISYLV